MKKKLKQPKRLKKLPIKRKEILQDALSALQNLGFKTAEAKSVLDKILVENDFKDASQLVKEALRSLARG